MRMLGLIFLGIICGIWLIVNWGVVVGILDNIGQKLLEATEFMLWVEFLETDQL